MHLLTKPIREAGGEVYLVGGSIRDELLGLKPNDMDVVVTGIPEEELVEVLKPLGNIKSVGKAFGVLNLSLRSKEAAIFGLFSYEIDVALPRVERSTGPGHRDFEVDARHDIPIEDDLGRRDFTMNAIAKNLHTGEILDPYSGRDDINARHLRAVFPRAFEEDPLRILRAAQFAARFNLVVDRRTMTRMTESSSKIKTLSGERIAHELHKMLMAPRPSIAFGVLHSCDALPYFLPELVDLMGVEQPRKHHHLDAYDHTMDVLDGAADMGLDLNLRLAALLHDLGKFKTKKVEEDGNIHFYGHQFISERLARKIGKRLKLSSAGFDMELVEDLCRYHMEGTQELKTNKSIRRFINRVGGPDHAIKLCNFRMADKKGGANADAMDYPIRFRRRVIDMIEAKEPFGLKDLVINGKDLIDAGMEPGPQFKKILNKLLDKVMDDPSLNEKDKLLKLAKRMDEGN